MGNNRAKKNMRDGRRKLFAMAEGEEAAVAKAEAEYFSKDFDWESLKQQVEKNPSYQFHLLPHLPSSSDEQREEETRDSKAWQSFHVRHSAGKFFKERRYLLKEFPELASSPKFSKVLEVGCGNGSSLIPVLRGNKNITVYACDCSSETLERVKEILSANLAAAALDRFVPFFCDFASTGFPGWLACHSCRGMAPQREHKSCSGVGEFQMTQMRGLSPLTEGGCCIGGVDFVTLIFTLSAVPHKLMPKSIKECFSVLKPGGILMFRDYGLYDMTMLRFEPDKRVGFREYMRGDGTRSYFFCLDTVRNLFQGAGFSEMELEYCCVKSENRRKGKIMQRVWVHGKFQKPML